MQTRITIPSLCAALVLALAPVSVAAQTRNAAASGPANVDAMVEGVLNLMRQAIDAHWHKGEYNHIINLSRIVVAADPGDLETYANAGWLLWSMARDAEAVALYEQGIKANPNESYMYDEMGQYYYTRKKDMPLAIKYYEQAVRFKDVQPVTLHMLAHAYEKNGQRDKAIAIWERAARDPKDGVAKKTLERMRAGGNGTVRN